MNKREKAICAAMQRFRTLCITAAIHPSKLPQPHDRVTIFETPTDKLAVYTLVDTEVASLSKSGRLTLGVTNAKWDTAMTRSRMCAISHTFGVPYVYRKRNASYWSDGQPYVGPRAFDVSNYPALAQQAYIKPKEPSMCDLFSWIVDSNGTVHFLTDAEAFSYLGGPIDSTAVGHAALIVQRYRLGVDLKGFKHCEHLLYVPRDLALAVNAGKLDDLQREGWPGLDRCIRQIATFPLRYAEQPDGRWKCSTMDFSKLQRYRVEYKIKVGDPIKVGEHRDLNGILNWNEEMPQYIGRESVVMGITTFDESEGATVKVKDFPWNWRLMNAQTKDADGDWIDIPREYVSIPILDADLPPTLQEATAYID